MNADRDSNLKLEFVVDPEAPPADLGALVALLLRLAKEKRPEKANSGDSST